MKNSIVLSILAASVILVPPMANAEFEVGLRTFYLKRDFSGPLDTVDREAFTQAVRVDYEKTLFDSLTFGASLFANAKIAESGASELTGLLTLEDGEGYAKIGQIYGQYDFEDIFIIRGGRWFLDTPLLNDSDSRATPSTTQAVQATGKYGDGELYGIYSDRGSLKTETDFEKYTNTEGEEHDIMIFGGNYSFASFDSLLKGLSLAAAYGEADEYSEQLYLFGSYQIKDFSVEATYYTGEGEDRTTPFDADLTNIAAAYKMRDLKLSVGYQTVSGDTAYRFTWGIHDDNGLRTSNSVQINDFNRQDEDSWQIRADYDVSMIPGLQFMARHTMGSYTTVLAESEAQEEVDESETNLEVKYTINEGFLKDLHFRVRYAHVEADVYDDIDEIRLIVNYSF